MSRHERAIKFALDKNSGEILEADDVFDSKTDGFIVRKRFHRKDVELYCLECEQGLNVSTSKLDNLHFKHKPKAEFCILKDGKLSLEEAQDFIRILRSKESPRHKYLKNEIARRLRSVEGVDVSSITVDNKFISKDDGRRKPDVYCKYFDKELVFEIQLSNLSLKYILDRYEFYREHKMYLIWVLDNFDVHNQSQLERDIKYLSEYQNFFNLDENTSEFKLNCRYKLPYITSSNQVHTVWKLESVSLSQVKFDSNAYQIYYSNFPDNLHKRELEQKKKEAEEKRERICIQEENDRIELARIEDEKKERALAKAESIISDIKRFKKNQRYNYEDIRERIEVLNSYELNILNSRLDLCNKQSSAIIHWIDTADRNDNGFIRFILECEDIALDLESKDSKGRSVFRALWENPKLDRHYPLRALLKRGYKFCPEDYHFYTSNLKEIEEAVRYWEICMMCVSLKNQNLIDDVFKHWKFLCIINSAKTKEIIGFRYGQGQWIAFANNVVEHHAEYWDYFETAFDAFGLSAMLVTLDKKGTFQQKVKTLNRNRPPQKSDVDSVFRDLFPELAVQMDCPF